MQSSSAAVEGFNLRRTPNQSVPLVKPLHREPEERSLEPFLKAINLGRPVPKSFRFGNSKQTKAPNRTPVGAFVLESRARANQGLRNVERAVDLFSTSTPCAITARAAILVRGRGLGKRKDLCATNPFGTLPAFKLICSIGIALIAQHARASLGWQEEPGRV